MADKHLEKLEEKKAKKEKKAKRENILVWVVFAGIILALAGAGFLISTIGSAPDNSHLLGTWKPVAATDMVTNEVVKISEIYKDKNSDFEGTLTFINDTDFTLIMEESDIDNPEARGKYTPMPEDVINFAFEAGGYLKSVYLPKEGAINPRVRLNYEGYTVLFERE
ncbi:MAG: hypothetical protein LBM65_00875 [Oscillospiraceae bacterium]|nr:hypothetical protein [Oscillospiraceae bacterium]